MLEFFAKHHGDTELADFTLTSSDGEDFQIHRMILADQSEFFKKMFRIDMKEKKAKSVTFEDIDSSTLKSVLKFFYTRELEIVDDKMTKDLLYAAEKFAFDDLKSFCAIKLIEKVTVENVLETFVTADMFNVEELEEKCLQIIVE